MLKSLVILFLDILLILIYYLGNYFVFSSEDNEVSYLIGLTFDAIEL